MDLVRTNTNVVYASGWRPVFPPDIPVPWLVLHENGRVELTLTGETWRLDQPIFGKWFDGWELRGVGGNVDLTGHGSKYLFQFDVVTSNWIYRVVRVESYEEFEAAQEPVCERDVPVAGESETTASPCLIATPLFDGEKAPHYQIGQLDGLTFFANGRLNYEGKTFAKHQEIEYTSDDLHFHRDHGRAKMLVIRDLHFGKVWRFSYHATIEHPLEKQWYHWNECKNPSLWQRLHSHWQLCVSQSMLLRVAVAFPLKLSTVLLALTFPFIFMWSMFFCWPLCLVFLVLAILGCRPQE